MTEIAAIILVLSVSLSFGAIVTLLRYTAVARWLMFLANGAAILGALEIVFGNELDGVVNWSFLFACGACGCGVVAVRNIDHRPIRWVHRFVIYAGYAATFATMSCAGLWLYAQNASSKVAAVVFIGVYIGGSICTFLAKTLTIRITRKTMPEYHASLGGDQREWR